MTMTKDKTMPALLLMVGIIFMGVMKTGAVQPFSYASRTNGAARSLVDLSRYSGRQQAVAVTPADFKQLAYELQALRTTRTTGRLPVAQQTPYATITPPRNNLGNHVPLSLIHWERDVDYISNVQERQAFATGIAPLPTVTNVTIFAVAPVRPTTYRGASVKISLSVDDYYEETGSSNTIHSLRIDSGDGTGWQDLPAGETVSASYDSTGTKLITVEATLADDSVLLAAAMLEVAALVTPDPTETITLAADAPYNNVTGTLYVYKSGSHTGLRCPTLVAEGFDMDNSMDWDVLYNILNEEQLAETLRSYGRDLIVLDYTNAMRNITENAALARAAIQYVNANRNNASDKFTVIGASMGGLVTRIALADMDRDPQSYGVSHADTWISFDSPHTGANIPLGIQEFLKFFYDKNSSFAAAAELYQILNTPAAKQMLLVHHSVNGDLAGNSDNDAFQLSLSATGYPSTCRKIAISNGSGYGMHLPFSAGERVLYWNYRSFLLDISAYIHALAPVASPLPTIFYGLWDTFLPFDEKNTTQKHYYPYSLDNAPGGMRNSFQVLFDSIPSGYRGDNDYCLWPDHCFIPAVSALGISIDHCNDPLHGDTAVLSQSPFDEIHYPSVNEPHIDINVSNKRWFMRAVLEGYDTDSDGYDDYQEYLIGTVYDSGSSKLEGASMKAMYLGLGQLNLTWELQANVNDRIYFTEHLAGEWTLVPPESYSLGGIPPQATAILPQLTESGFYKIVSEIQDPVTD